MSSRVRRVFRLVLDTSVIVAALRSRRGASNEVLRNVATRRLVLLATPALFLEYEDVLKRAEQQAVHGLSNLAVERFLAALAAVVEPVTVRIVWRPQLRDPADEMVLEAAINGRADAIATFNARDFLPAAARFGLKILRPAEVLEKVRS